MSEYAEGRLVARVEGGIGWLIFNQPERLNAIRYDMWTALPQAVGELAASLDIRCVIATGAGDRAFVSGADIVEFETQRRDSAANRVFTEAVSAATRALIEAPLPVIAMIDGFCIGGGMVIASACDLRIASEGSLFGVPAGKLGLGYELDNLKRLIGIVGPGVAMDFLMTARQVPAEDALACGFLNRLAPRNQLRAVTLDYAAMISQLAPMTLRAAKLSRRAAFDPALNGAAQAAIDACFDSEDFREGRAAFAAKRKPLFKGR